MIMTPDGELFDHAVGYRNYFHRSQKFELEYSPYLINRAGQSSVSNILVVIAAFDAYMTFNTPSANSQTRKFLRNEKQKGPHTRLFETMYEPLHNIGFIIKFG